MDKIKMGAYLQSLRNERGLTQQDEAEIFAITPQAISKWESGQSIPDVEMLEKLSRFYKVNINEILTGEQSETTQASSTSAETKEEKPQKSGLISRLVPFITSCFLLVLSLVAYLLPLVSGYTTDCIQASGYFVLSVGTEPTINKLFWISLLLLLAIFVLGFCFFYDGKHALKYRLAQEIIMWVTLVDYHLIGAVAVSSEVGVELGYTALGLILIVYIVLFYVLPQNKRKRLKSI